jgi:hypothetical protein
MVEPGAVVVPRIVEPGCVVVAVFVTVPGGMDVVALHEKVSIEL